MRNGYKTLPKLDAVVSRINTHPEYSTCVREGAQRALQEQAAYHSHLLELNGEAKPTPELRKEVVQHLAESWDHLAREGINAVSLSKLGYIIEPEKNPTRAYRNEDVAFGGLHPPPTARVPYEIDNLVYRLTQVPQHPVLRAIEAHFDLVRIHPFMDGNGRAARILQNFCLQERGYPAAVISSHERQLYLGLMSQALKESYNSAGSIEEPGVGQKLFHEFMISKIVNSAEQIENELRKRRSYEIQIKGDPGELYAVAKLVRAIGGHERPITVSVKKMDGKLKIRGDVSTAELEHALEQIPKARKHAVITSNMKDC